MNTTIDHVYWVMEGPRFGEKMVITPRADLIPGFPDYFVALATPIVAYWVYATFFHIIDIYQLAEKFRIHPSEEEEKRNKVTLKQVMWEVLFQHVIQTLVGTVMYYIDDPKTTGHELHLLWQLRHQLPLWVPLLVIYYGYYYGWPFFKFCLGMVIIDTWQYMLHRLMHENKWLYRRFHSRHHRLYVPYAYGALYNNPVEGFFLDTAGAGLAQFVCQMTPRECIALFCFSTMKTVDDHLGYRLPYDPFQMLFPNNTVYHDIHHQQWGIKNNFSQPFFVFWDKLFNTDYKFIDEYKHQQSQITLERYKAFLETKDRSKKKETKKTE